MRDARFVWCYTWSVWSLPSVFSLQMLYEVIIYVVWNAVNIYLKYEWMNEWMMHLSVLLCIAVHPKRFTIMWGGTLLTPPVCCIHMDDATAATGQRHQCAHHTPATGGEKRVIETIKCMRSPHTQLQVARRESHRANQVYALTTYQLQVERKRVIEPIKWGDY